MANPEHVEILKQGVEVWNRWREEHPDIRPNLVRANFSGAELGKADLSGADLRGATLANAILIKATLRGANLNLAQLDGANLVEADLSETDLNNADLNGVALFRANLRRSDLRRAELGWSNLVMTDLREADLRGTNLGYTNLTKADFCGTDLTGCRIYGISAWDLKLDGAIQSDLIITPSNEPIITVDSLEVAQFIYLLLHNEKIRHVIDTITSKVVLILGRFTPERKAILDAIRDELRRHDLLPVMFDFQKPESRDFTETVSTLAHMARFVIADMTDAKIVLEEVPHIVRNIAVPLVPLLLEGEEKSVTLYNLRRNHRSVLPTLKYTDIDDLLASLEEKVIAPAQAKFRELQGIR